MLPTITPTASAAGSGVADRLNALRSKYTQGAYWNHYVSQPGQDCDSLSVWDETYANSVTNTPCAHHGDGYQGNYVGLYDCNRFDGGSQCWGFARKVFYDVFGVKCTSITARNGNIANVQVGDYVRFGTDRDGHSCVVLERNGNTIKVVECNTAYGDYSGKCRIRWTFEYDLTVGVLKAGGGYYRFGYSIHAPNYDEINGSSQPTAPSVNLGDDFFAYIRHTHSGYNLENNSFNVQLASSNSKEPRQIWHFMRQADNSYKIVNMYDGLYLEVANAGTAWGTNVQVMTGDNNPNNAQKWLICGPNAYSNMFYLAPGLSKDHTLVLDVAGGDSAIFPGQNICINKSWYGLEGSGHINNGPFHQAQTFQIQKISGNIGTQLSYNMGSDFYARVGHNGHYIEASGVVTESGSNMDVQSSGIYQNNPKQIWHFIRQSNGTYKAVNEYSGWCLDVSSFAANNVKVRMWYIDNGTPAQQWYPIKSRGESTYRLASALLYPWNGEHALFSLTMPLSISGSVLSGTKPVIRQQSHEANQHFNITTASYTRPGAPSAPQNIRVNATSSGTTITWDPVPEVNGFDEREYFVYLIGDGPVSDIAFTQTVPTASCTSSVVLEPGPYVVGVRARNVKYPKTSTNYQSAVSTLFTDILSTYTVDVNAAEGGTVRGGGTYQDGDSVTVVATPQNGYHFVKWTENGNEVSTSASYQFSVNADRVLTAVFEKDAPPAPTMYTVSVSAGEGGSVTGGGSYEDGSSATVIATPGSGYEFREWTENGKQVSTSASYTFTVSRDRQLTAVFEKKEVPPTPPASYTISVNSSPATGGTVTGGGSFSSGDPVTVTAVPSNGYQFKEWRENGRQVSTNASYTFTTSANRVLTAVFEEAIVPPATYTIKVSATPGGFASGGGVYRESEQVTVTAAPSTGYRFKAWTAGGLTVSTDVSYTFTASEDRELTAVFEKVDAPVPKPVYTLDVHTIPVDGGAVTGHEAGTYEDESSVTLMASANAGYRFARWVEGGNTVSTDAAYTFTIDGNRALTAVFELETPTPTPSYVISVDASPAEYGTVMGGGEYQEGDTITIAATPNSGYRFVEWRLDGSPISTTASYTFTASANQSYMAVFEKQEDAPPTPSAYTINVHASPAAGGTVSGGGTYQSGKAVTLTAAANTGYRFVEWQSGGTRVSTSARYTFYASANQTYTAIFEEQSETPRPVYTITVNANPAAGGSVSGGGRFEKGTSVTVVATASSSYRFAGWFENGAQVSAALSYTFTASVDRALTASFVYTGSDAGNTPGDEPNDNTHAGNSSSSNTPTAKPPLPVSTNSTSDAVTTTASPDAAITGTTAVTTITSEVAAEIIKQAVANGSEQVVIASATGADVTKAQVTLPANVLYEIERQTSADLTVSTLIADVSFHNDGLSKLSDKESVTVTVERTGTMFGLSITSGGQTVEQVRGGIVLDIPIDHGTPGSVAVLVHEDGSRQVVRKSVVNKNTITVPLSGPAVLEIVDRSKRFIDVASDSWAADAVAFASGHELFNGISPDTFGPDLPMTRGMLAMVLHNLEGNPEQATAETFSDVDASAWYAEAVAWSSARGIVSGYGNGLFGPGDNITREQLAVMLWRYAGEPAATNKELHFNDADEVSGYALDALIWTIENNIINGKGSGILDPRGQTTRAQVAQMLMNYLRK